MTYCTCDVPNIDPVTFVCRTCKTEVDLSRIVWETPERWYYVPPTLGIHVKESAVAKDKVG